MWLRLGKQSDFNGVDYNLNFNALWNVAARRAPLVGAAHI